MKIHIVKKNLLSLLLCVSHKSHVVILRSVEWDIRVLDLHYFLQILLTLSMTLRLIVGACSIC